MDIRTSLDGLKSLLGVAPAPAAATQQARNTAPTAASALSSDSATLSSAGSEVSLAASESDVRTGKVAAIQSALAAGTYSVPASAVASRVVDAMLGGQQ
jgi:negative regulator of flagellin synthesis FlgM